MSASINARSKAPGIDAIQYMRAVAAILVVYYHTLNYGRPSHWPVFGAEGVDVFFVISGFIMAYTTAGPMKPGMYWQASIDFMLRRILRVVPLYWIALTLAWRKEIFSGQAGIAALQDYLFVPHYHQVRTDMIWPYLVPGWTINYEMAFYLLFAMSILTGRFRLVSMCLLLLGIVVGVWVVGDASESVYVKFYGSPIILEFLFGIVLFLVVSGHLIRLQNWVWSALGVGALVVLFQPNSVHRAFADGLPAFFLLLALLNLRSGWRSRLLRLLGDASYSIYLFHLFALEAIEKVIRISGGFGVSDDLLVPVRLSVAVGIGVVIHIMLERPLTRWMQSIADSVAKIRAGKLELVLPKDTPEASAASVNIAPSGYQAMEGRGFSLRDFPDLSVLTAGGSIRVGRSGSRVALVGRFSRG